MRLGSLTLSASVSAILLSGCSFISGQPSQFKNPFAKQKAAHQGQYYQAGAAANCQIPTPRAPIPRGCRPEQVTIGLAPQYGGPQLGTNGFPQQPQFGQPEYANGAYGAAVGQSASVAHHTAGPKTRKPKLRGSLSLGLERSISGALLGGVRDDLDPAGGYNPQIFNEGFLEGSQAEGLITRTTFTANELDAADIFAPNQFDRATSPSISFDDAWATPAQIKAGLEYIVNDRTTVFANGGYTYAEGNAGDVASVEATLYRRTSAQAYTPELDDDGNEVAGSFVEAGDPVVGVSFNPNHTIASFAYDFSDLRQYDLEVGARHYFNPMSQSDGYRTITPFVGASVGASHVNAVDISVSQRQAFYQRAFEGSESATTYDVPSTSGTTRIYDSQWLPQAQLNVGAEWQLTPGFALAAETGVKVQGAREYADFTNAAGEIVSGQKGDRNISIPLTLRGSVNF